MKMLMASASSIERGRRAPRGPKSKVWGQNRRKILKFLIDVFPSKSDSEEIDSQWTFLRRTGHRAPRSPKSKI
jgi:hypothetical protein